MSTLFREFCAIMEQKKKGVEPLDISKRLRDLREDNDLTQKQLAAKLGVPLQRVSEWERNIHLPRLDVLCQLADIYGVSLDYLAGREPQRVIKKSPSK